MFIISIKLSKRVTHMFVCASVWESSAVLGCAGVRANNGPCKGGESFCRGEKACESVTEVSTRSEAATAEAETAPAAAAATSTAATTMMTATQWEIGAKPQLSWQPRKQFPRETGQTQQPGPDNIFQQWKFLSFKKAALPRNSTRYGLVCRIGKLKTNTHTLAHTQRERERASKSEVDQDKSSESLYCCVEIVFNFRYLTNGDTSAVAARTPASSPGRLGQDFNNMCTPTHVCVSWGFVNNKFLCRKTRSCLWQSPIRCSILGLSRIIIIIRIIVRISISRSGFVCTAEKR